jgi:hypothetical protein
VHEGDNEERVEGVDKDEDEDFGNEGVFIRGEDLMVLEVVETHAEI